MKTVLYTSLIIFLLNLTFSCREECDDNKNCIEDVLDTNGMVKYGGQELGCNTFLELYKFNGQQYFLLNNHCADMIVYPFDCSGNKLCEVEDEQNCINFYETAENIGV